LQKLDGNQFIDNWKNPRQFAGKRLLLPVNGVGNRTSSQMPSLTPTIIIGVVGKS